MAAPLPSAKVVAPPSSSDWLLAGLMLLLAIVPPVAFRLTVPLRTAPIAWAMHAIPIVAWALAVVAVVRAGASPWDLVRRGGLRADARRWVYAGFGLAFTVGYLIAFKYLIPNRLGWAQALLELLPLATWCMVTGTLIARRGAWWLVLVGGVALLVWTIGALIVLTYTASYLAGVYGAFGKGASAGVYGAMALLVQFVALLPAFQLKWIMTRAGRRVFGLAPLWSAPGRAVTAPARSAA